MRTHWLTCGFLACVGLTSLLGCNNEEAGLAMAQDVSGNPKTLMQETHGTVAVGSCVSVGAAGFTPFSGSLGARGLSGGPQWLCWDHDLRW